MQHSMGYGGMRGGYNNQQHHHHQQPQPQRNQQRRNGRFRPNSRFDNQRNQNQHQRSNKEIKTEPATQPEPVKQVQAPAPVQEQKPPVNQQPIQNAANKPAAQPQPQQTPSPANKPQPANQQNKPAQPQNQNASHQPNTTPNSAQKNPKNMNSMNNQNANNQQQNANKPQQQNMNKPQQQQNLNKPQQQQQNMNSKPQQQQQNMNKPQQQNINKPQQQQNVNKPQQSMNKPQQQNQGQNQQLNQQHSQQNQQQNNMNNKGSMNQQGGARNMRRGHLGQDKGPGGPRDDHFMNAKLKEISGSTIDIPPLDQVEQKFSGRNRLYIGNLTNDVTEQEVLDLFSPYGETAELFINKDKNFAFIRIDYKANADKAKREVDGRMRRGRPLRVRFAPHNAAIKVKNLTPYVSNELLYRAFEIFGKLERAVIKVDERGKSLGEGVVEFARKAGAMAAIRNCTERCFFLTGSLRPVVVECFEEVDEADGYTEKSMPRKNQEFIRAREIGPRFAEAGSFEHEYGTRWKQLYELFKQKEEALKREMHMEEDKLEAQMEYAKYEHETELLRDQLRQREQDRERQKRSWEMAERNVDEQREKERETLLLQQEDMAQRMRHQEDELRRRQKENTLFMQAQQLNRILDEQEQGISGGGRGYDNSMQDVKRSFDGMSGMGPMSNMGGSMQMDTPYMEHYDQMCGHMGYEESMGRWDSRQEDYPNKRRRY